MTEGMDELAQMQIEDGETLVYANGEATRLKPDKDYLERISSHVAAFREAMDAKALESYPQNLTGIHPTEFKVLILPDPVEEVTKGGIIVPTSKAEADKYATIEGRIIAVSHLAFTYATAEEWGDAKPKPGDRVIFAKYAGVRHKAKDGQEYLLVNDKDIVATIED